MKQPAVSANRRLPRRLPEFCLAVLLPVSITAGLLLGSVPLSLQQIAAALRGQDAAAGLLLLTIRLPRVAGGLLAGAGLACAGVILQGVLNNALASPGVIGVNSGAGFAVMVSLLFFPYSAAGTPLIAFAGALAAAGLVYGIACAAGCSRLSLILAGVTVSSILGAGMNLVKLLDADIAVDLSSFLLGSFSGLTLKKLLVPACLTATALAAALRGARALDVLGMGDDAARSLGLRVELARGVFLLLASAMAGAAVSCAGLLGFVGLIVPHICRGVFGGNTARLLRSSAVFGACFVVLCDLAARTLFAPFELPAGIVMSFLGGPFFLYLVLSGKGGRRFHA